MLDAKTFNPEILYVFDSSSTGPMVGPKHAHDFLELTILFKGEAFFVLENEAHYLTEGTVLILNPGMEHQDYTEENMNNRQIHIGLRNFNFPGYKQNFLPLESAIVQLGSCKKAFFDVCAEIVRERKKAEPGYELVLKALVYKLLVYLLRDSNTALSEEPSLLRDKDKQELVNKIRLYIENHYRKDLSLEQIARTFYTNSTTLSRLFKQFLNDTPINYLINYRLEQARSLLLANPSLPVKEVAKAVGYDDPLYFSRLFKKRFGDSPSFFAEELDAPQKPKN